MLAVNGKVSGYCVHLPVCNLQKVISTEKVSHLRESTLWEKLLPCPRSLELESMRTGGHPDHRSTLPIPLPFPHTHYTHSSCLVGFLGCKHGCNKPNGRKFPMKRSLPDVFLTILMELDPPTFLPCIVLIMRMIFTFYSVSF